MNVYAKLKLTIWCIVLVITYPVSYLLFAVDLGWATIPIILTFAFIYAFLFAAISVAHERANEKIIGSVCSDCLKPIYKLDDAEVCINCGGRNRRIY